jgi:hypothetical protein
MRTLKAIAWALALALPAGAFGQDDTTQRSGDLDRGVEVQAVGGARGFVTNANDVLMPGPAYGVVVGIEALPVLGLELGYQGASYETDTELPGDQQRVNQNGGQALIKASPKFGAIEPYAFGGVDISQITATGGDDLFVTDDTLVAIPVGLGIDFHVPVGDATNLLIGARGTYAFGTGNDAAFPTVNEVNNDWLQVALQAGAQF